MDFMQLAKNRYSERFFDAKPVEQEKIDKILEAGRIVQTAGREQLGDFAPMFAHLNDDVLFGEVWNEEAIDVKTKCIITHATMYVGWPKGWAVFRLAKEVWNDYYFLWRDYRPRRKIKGQNRNSEERTMRRIIDVCMTLALLVLMAYQVTGETVHEWTGILMTVLVITHQVLNRRWYKTLFKGKYNPYRTLTTAVNILLLLSFALTAFSGMAMSNHAVPFLHGMVPVSLARQTHLAMSHWSFVLMGTHLGLHIPAMTAGMKLEDRKRTAALAVFCALACVGMYLFIRNGMFNYMFFRAAFAFLDYDKAGVLVFLEILLILLAWAFIGDRAAVLCKKTVQKRNA